MKEKEITCGICRDLMPSYCDGLLSDDVREAVENHLSDCEACRAFLEELRAQASQNDSDDRQKEETFLKKARTANYYLIGIVAGALVPVALLAAFLIYTLVFSGVRTVLIPLGLLVAFGILAIRGTKKGEKS